MARRLVLFLLKTYFVRVVWKGSLNRARTRLTQTFSMRNILGDSVGTWWDMRKLK
ncbi:MAG: hypothetical protein RDV00_05345 [Clostridia bacterium]|jgi:hypothetical protein|nr:hypothetical protein [Clostridia bacterium]MDQ7791531.1 hypothetical protein [Clostridia bacterium]